jgi:hypothetical protein
VSCEQAGSNSSAGIQRNAFMVMKASLQRHLSPTRIPR